MPCLKRAAVRVVRSAKGHRWRLTTWGQENSRHGLGDEAMLEGGDDVRLDDGGARRAGPESYNNDVTSEYASSCKTFEDCFT